MTDLSEENESIILEVSPYVNIDDHLELRYNLGALSSGIGNSDIFRVISDDKTCLASIVALNGKGLSLTLYNENSIDQFFVESIDEAIMILTDGSGDLEIMDGKSSDEILDEVIEAEILINNIIESDEYLDSNVIERLKLVYLSLGEFILEI